MGLGIPLKVQGSVVRPVIFFWSDKFQAEELERFGGVFERLSLGGPRFALIVDKDHSYEEVMNYIRKKENE